MKIGILAVQGDFEAHAAMLRELGAETVEVRTVADLDDCDGLILPGGESTTQLQFLREEGLYDAIREFSAEGGAIFGTCAGAILLATEVKNPAQDSLKLLDMTILRNGYGRQLASAVFFGPCTLKKEPLEMVFIRAPIIEIVSSGISVLAKHQGNPVLVQNGHILAATFHPELTDDATVHRHFLELVALGSGRQKTQRQHLHVSEPPNRQRIGPRILSGPPRKAAPTELAGEKARAQTAVPTVVTRIKGRSGGRANP